MQGVQQSASADTFLPEAVPLTQSGPPKWSTHSLRRLADTVARRYKEESGTTEAEIDLYFGWNERMVKKAMQAHYASLSIRERMALARITGKM